MCRTKVGHEVREVNTGAAMRQILLRSQWEVGVYDLLISDTYTQPINCHSLLQPAIATL